MTPVAVVEGVFGGLHTGAVRGFIGANVVFPDGDLQNIADEQDEDCRSIVVEGGACDVTSGPYVGLSLGAAGAYIAQVSAALAARLELSLQYVSFSGPRLEGSDQLGREFTSSFNSSGVRIALRFGIEF